MVPEPRTPSSRWSNRILIVAIIGIVYFTLFPFRFNFRTTAPGYTSPFLLGPSQKNSINLDFFLNVLLFIPFGIGLGAQLRKRGVKRLTGFILALTGGILVSYTIEFLQIYVPMRSSGWDDVFSNSLGSVVGFCVFELCGDAVFQQLSKAEAALRMWISPRRAAVLLSIYFGVWFGVSIYFQEQTRLSNWDDQCPLIVGNDFSGGQPWSGRMLSLQVWNHAVPQDRVHQLMTNSSDLSNDPGLLAWYEFSSSPPFEDRKKLLPALALQAGMPSIAHAEGLKLDSQSWLTTSLPVANLTGKVRETNQFALRVKCAAGTTRSAPGLIVSISRSADAVDLSLWQDGTSLGFWFRNPISVGKASLVWYVPGVFQSQGAKDILVSYNGADATVYVDGSKIPRDFRLGPGTSFAQRFAFVRTRALPGYVVVYATLIFLPAGVLIGLTSGRFWTGSSFEKLLLTLLLLAPPVMLEILLMWVSGRGIIFSNVMLSLFFAITGLLLITADDIDDVKLAAI